MADSWSEDAALSLSLSISLASVLAGVQTSQRRLRICICILQTIEKVVKVFHAALLCFHFITHTHMETHSKGSATWCFFVFVLHMQWLRAGGATGCDFCLPYYSWPYPPPPPNCLVPPLGIHHLKFFVVLALHFAHFRYLPAAVA